MLYLGNTVQYKYVHVITVLTGMCDDIMDQSGDEDGLKKDF